MHKEKPIIAFGAHPDDIEIGMGGTLAKLAASGRNVVACIASVPNERETRIAEARKAAAALGLRDVVFMDVPPDTFGFNRKTIGAIDNVIASLSPGSVFTHWTGDSHQDHVNLTRCVLAGARHNHFNVYMYEQTIPGGITNMHFRPQLFVDISDHFESKLKAVRTHASQLKKYGNEWTEGIRGRAMHRGYQIKAEFAEAFEVVKIKDETGFFS